ncbi:MAG TPA: glucose-6-phosphate dehydrogenase, partial [Candidatus Dormibacteraeota bacterium]|nr:glucose-6-phosphate dehydrogenase [Candidatus Dormibacteraeota bacterium]
LFQIMALLAMEAPAGPGVAPLLAEKAKVFGAMRPLAARDLVRGQFQGYRAEPGVAPDSDAETYCAIRLHVDSWRWAGVPWYLRAGKCLPVTATEVLVQLRRPPQRLFADSWPAAGRANYVRFRVTPGPAIALAARVKRAGEAFVGDQQELYLRDDQPDEEAPYERLLGDALAGHRALFTREDAVEAAWAVVEPVLREHPPALPYAPGTWGPPAADRLVAAAGGWHNPAPDGRTAA